MKRLVPFLICVMSALSCNPDVFIEPFEIEFSGTEFEVPFTGGTIDIEASHGDWTVQKIRLWGDSERPMFNKEEIRYVSDFKSFELTRPTPSGLRFTLHESVDSNPSELQIYIGNEYEYRIITINIGPCSGYSFDRIEYGTPVVLSEEDAYEQIWGLTTENKKGNDFINYYNSKLYAEKLDLREEIEKLSENEKRLIKARYYEDLTQTETSKKLGISQVQVSRNENKILKKLRTNL